MALGSARLKEHQKLALVVYFLIHLFDIYNTQNQRQMSHQSPFSDGDNNNTMPRQALRSSNKQAHRESTIATRRSSTKKKQPTTTSGFGNSGPGLDLEGSAKVTTR